MSARALLAYAARSLRRGGRRSLLALTCIAFGVLSLVAMLLLSAMVRHAMLSDPRAVLGGDFSLTRSNRPLMAEDVAELDRMQRAGMIDAYALTLNAGFSMMRSEQSGRVYFLSRVLGVDPTHWPLIGEAPLEQPQAASLGSVLRRDDSAVITRDLAAKLNIGPGDRIVLGGSPGRPPVTVIVTGIAGNLPDRRGDTILLPLAAASQLSNGVVAGAAGILTSRAPADFAGWSVRTRDDAVREAGAAPRLFDFALKGAGLLGLLIGGIGVANTLQVVLARRTAEIAVLKSIGYRRNTLLALFAVETGMLGLVGSLVGVACALLVSAQLAGLLNRLEGALLIEYAVDPLLVIAGLVLGILTSVLFGLHAIVRAAAVRPSTLLRQLPLQSDARTRWTRVALNALLVGACAAIGALVMGSALRGAQVIAAGMVGLVVLGALHAALLAILIRLPIPAPLIRLAQRNVRHRPVRAIFAAVALFVGVFSIGFAGSALFTARDRVEGRRGTVEGVNLVSYVPLAREDHALRTMRAAGAVDVNAMISVAVRSATASDGSALRIRSVVGRDPASVALAEGTWTNQAGAILLPTSRNRTASARVGDVITVEGNAGSLQLQVAGIFEPAQSDVASFFDLSGPIVDRATALTLAAGQASVVVQSHVPAELLETASERVGRALPEAMVVSRADVNSLLVRAYEGLFAFAAGIAALALLAGAVLVANAVGLGLLERRKELGILKAIGWTRRWVLGSVLIENGLLGALAGTTGMAGVAVAIAFVNVKQPAAGLALRPVQSLALASIAILLALGAAALVAWRPTAARPLVVLREECATNNE